MESTEPVVKAPSRVRVRWWREVIYVLVFYVVYSFIRNRFGSALGHEQSYDNALKIIRAEERLGLFFEPDLQAWFLPHEWFIRIWNVFYGSLHFIVTGGVMVWMYRAFPWRYRRWRNVLAWTTGLALIGFSAFPLMPPRLLHTMTDDFAFVDTLDAIGGLWSFSSGGMNKVSNQYAAMPSLHVAWSTWSALVIIPLARRRWVKVAAAVYPLVTLFAIMVTANHYWLDAVGGLIVLFAGILVAVLTTPVLSPPPPADEDDPAAVALHDDELGLDLQGPPLPHLSDEHRPRPAKSWGQLLD